MDNILQIYNWSEESSSYLSNIRFERVIVCNAFRQSDYQHFSVIFPSFWTNVIPLSEAAEFEENNSSIIYREEFTARIAEYGSTPMTFVRYYLNKRVYEQNYFSGKSVYDIFFNYSRINPSSFIRLDVAEQHGLKFQPYTKLIHGRQFTEYIAMIPFEKIAAFADCTVNPRFEHDVTPVPVDVMAFDIEVYFDHSGITFVSPTRETDYIVCIVGVLKLHSNKALSDYLRTLGVRWNYTGQVTLSIDFYPQNPVSRLQALADNHNIRIQCSSEYELITQFVNILHWVNPHHITGHNVIGFDLKFLQDRISYLNGRLKSKYGKNANMIPLIEVRRTIISPPTGIVIRSMSSYKGRSDVSDNSGNVLIIDFMNYVKKYNSRLESFTLEHCVNTLLSWKSKILQVNDVSIWCSLPENKLFCLDTMEYIKLVDHLEIVEASIIDTDIGKVIEIDASDITDNYLVGGTISLAHCKAPFDVVDEFSDYTRDRHERLVKYCMHDSTLSMTLYCNEDVDNSIIAFAMYNCMSQNEVTIYQNNRSVTSVLLQKVDDAKLVIRTHSNKDMKRYKAAFVQQPPKEFFDDPILVYDIEAQYPSAFISANLSYETIATMEVHDNPVDMKLASNRLKKQYGITPNCTDFILIESTTSDKEPIPEYYIAVSDRRTVGVIPKMLSELLDERRGAKKKISELSKIKASNVEEKIKNERLIKFLKRLETALKLFVNSTYGFMGSSMFELSMPILAGSCTAVGVSIIKHLISTLHSTITVLFDVIDKKVVDISFRYNHEIIQPFDRGIMNTGALSKKITFTDRSRQSVVIINSTSAYSDTDSCFQQCKIVRVINGNHGLELTESKPNDPLMLELMFEFGGYMSGMLNKHCLLNMFNLKFEKMLTYLSIIKKRYSSYIFTDPSQIRASWKMSQSGGSLIQRSTNRFHKSVINRLERYVRKLVIESTSQSEISQSLNAEIERIKLESIQNLRDGVLEYRDFMRSRGFRKTKNPDFRAYRMIVEHNEQVAAGLSTSKLPIIKEGERYYTVLLIDTGKPPSKKISDHEYLITGEKNEIIEGKEVYFSHYWNLIESDIERRYSIWK